MPLRIVPYQPQTALSVVGAPRASVPGVIDPTGAAISNLGAQVQRAAADSYESQVAMDLQDRIGKTTAEIAALRLESERDQDFRTSPQRFKDASEAIRDKYAEGLNPAAAVAFKRQSQSILTTQYINVAQDARRKEIDYGRAALDENVDTYATLAANAKNPAEAALLEQQMQLAVATAQSNNYISAQEAGKITRRFLEKRDEAIVRRDINTIPDLAAKKLSGDPSYAERLDPVTREVLLRSAIAQSEHVVAQAEAQRKRDLQQTQEDIVQKLGAGKLTVNDILSSNLAPTGDGSKEHFLNVLRTRSKEAAEAPIKTVPSVMTGLLERIWLPDGDPRKLVNDAPAQKAYLAKQLSWDDMQRVRKEIADARTDGGQKLGQTRETFFTAVKPQLDKSTMVFVDPKGGEAMYRFRLYAQEKEAEFAKQGKDRYQLYNPNSPDYLGKSLPAFQRSLDEQVRDMANAVRGPAATPPSPAATPPSPLPSQALAQLREGVVTTFANGQVWTLKQGQAVRVK